MKRPSYKEAIEYIALNDSPGDEGALNPEDCSGLVTSQLVSAIFHIDSKKVGKDVAIFRKKHSEGSRTWQNRKSRNT